MAEPFSVRFRLEAANDPAEFEEDDQLQDYFQFWNDNHIGELGDPNIIGAELQRLNCPMPDIDIDTWAYVCQAIVYHIDHPMPANGGRVIEINDAAAVLNFLIRKLNLETVVFLKIIFDGAVLQTSPFFNTMPVTQQHYVIECCLYAATHFHKEGLNGNFFEKAMRAAGDIPDLYLFRELIDYSLTLLSSQTARYFLNLFDSDPTRPAAARALARQKSDTVAIIHRRYRVLSADFDAVGKYYE